MNTNRRQFVRILFLAANAAAASQFFPARIFAEGSSRPYLAQGFNFLVFGDWGRDGEQDQSEVAAQMALAAESTKARFVVSVGDNFYNNGVSSIHDPQWESSLNSGYEAPALQIPWHAILGNHDYHGNCDAQIEYSRHNPRWNMPARYYQQTHSIAEGVGADFFYLDTSPMIEEYTQHPKLAPHIGTQDVPKQLAWLEKALAASQAKWKIVFAHHPIYSGGEHGDTPELIRDVLPLLQNHGVQAWFNGHDHDLQHLITGGVNLFCTGAGSRVRPTQKIAQTRFSQSRSGFTAISMHPETMVVRMTDNQGQVLYTTTVARKPAAKRV